MLYIVLLFDYNCMFILSSKLMFIHYVFIILYIIKNNAHAELHEHYYLTEVAKFFFKRIYASTLQRLFSNILSYLFCKYNHNMSADSQSYITF